jgi:hypothetical protein
VKQVNAIEYVEQYIKLRQYNISALRKMIASEKQGTVNYAYIEGALDGAELELLALEAIRDFLKREYAINGITLDKYSQERPNLSGAVCHVQNIFTKRRGE